MTDPIFHAKRFSKLPLGFLKNTIECLLENQQQLINAKNVSVAKLACLIYGALGGKSQKVDVYSFLPFEKPKDKNGISPSTIAALKWALKHETMPPSIIGMIGAELT